MRYLAAVGVLSVYLLHTAGMFFVHLFRVTGCIDTLIDRYISLYIIYL